MLNIDNNEIIHCLCNISYFIFCHTTIYAKNIVNKIDTTVYYLVDSYPILIANEMERKS